VNISLIGTKITKSRLDGILLSDMAIANLELINNECFYNTLNGINMKEMHQKSNKFKFMMVGNKCRYSEKGYGFYLNDAGGFLIENCESSENKEGGFFANCIYKPSSFIF
jgi:hypothetical protein